MKRMASMRSGISSNKSRSERRAEVRNQVPRLLVQTRSQELALELLKKTNGMRAGNLAIQRKRGSVILLARVRGQTERVLVRSQVLAMVMISDLSS